MKNPGSAHHACMSQEFDNKPGQRYSTIIRIILIKILRYTNHKLLLYGYHCVCYYLMTRITNLMTRFTFLLGGGGGELVALLSLSS